MRSYLGPPRTDSCKIWCVRVFHHVLLKYGHENAEMQKGKKWWRHTSVLYTTCPCSINLKWATYSCLKSIHTLGKIYHSRSFSNGLTCWSVPFEIYTPSVQHFGSIYFRGCTHCMWNCAVSFSTWNYYSLCGKVRGKFWTEGVWTFNELAQHIHSEYI